jgi:hypothetical protein
MECACFQKKACPADAEELLRGDDAPHGLLQMHQEIVDERGEIDVEAPMTVLVKLNRMSGAVSWYKILGWRLENIQVQSEGWLGTLWLMSPHSRLLSHALRQRGSRLFFQHYPCCDSSRRT